MRWGCILGILAWLSASVATGAAVSDPKSRQFREIVDQVGRDRLQTVLQDFRRGGLDLAALGFDEGDRKTLRAYLANSPALPARWDADAIRIDAGGVQLSAGIAEYWRGSIRLNGIEFRWDGQKSAEENLRALDAVFVRALQPAHAARFPSFLVPSAWADEVRPFNVQTKLRSSVVTLQFIIRRDGPPGSQLARLDTRIQAETKRCLRQVASDPFGDAGRTAYDGRLQLDHAEAMKEYAQLNSGVTMEYAPTFKNCKTDVAEYIKTMTQLSKVSTRKGDETPPAEPKDFCDHVQALQACIKDVYAKGSATGRGDKSYTLPFANSVAQEATQDAATAGVAGK